jgi:lysyl-tRNA synthetase class 2
MALSEQEILRREALTELRKLESTLIRKQFITTAYSSDILADFENTKLILGTFDGKAYHGKASFAELKDTEGRIKFMFLEMTFRMMKKKSDVHGFQKTVDIGDFIGVRGTVFKTQLAKSLFIFMV